MATTTYRSASYLVLHLEIEERLSTKLYDKRDDLNFPIVNIPFSNNLQNIRIKLMIE
jgi:hypothetical protein